MTCHSREGGGREGGSSNYRHLWMGEGGTSDWDIPLLYFELTTFLCNIMLNLKEITTEKTKKKSEYLNHVLRRVLNHVLNLKYLNHVLNHVLNHLLRR